MPQGSWLHTNWSKIHITRRYLLRLARLVLARDETDTFQSVNFLGNSIFGVRRTLYRNWSLDVFANSEKIHRQTTTAANVFMDFLTNLYSRKSQHTCVKLLNFIHFICSALALRICIEQSFKHVLDEHYYVSVRRHHNFVCCQWLSCTLLTHRVELFVSILHHVVARASGDLDASS